MAPQVGDRIKFRPTHQKDLELTGEVKAVHGDHVEVLSEAANGSVERLYVADLKDCSSPLGDGPVDDPPGQASV